MDRQEGDTKYCANCKRDITAANFELHQIHCQRNLILCPKCKEPVSRNRQKEHEEQLHALVTCVDCSDLIEIGKLDSHKDECQKRLVACCYCDLEVQMDDLDEHESDCGARTDACEKCGQYVMKKDFIKHVRANCNYPKTAATRRSLDAVDGNLFNVLHDEQLMENYYNECVMGKAALLSADTAEADQPNNTRRRTWSGRGSVPVVDNIHSDAEPSAAAKEKNINRIPTVEASAYFGKHIEDDVRNILPDCQRSTNLEADAALAWQLATQLDLARDLYDDTHLGGQEVDQHNLVSPSTPSPNVSDDETGEPALPCEFCCELFPFDDLILHQSGCTPDLAQKFVKYQKEKDKMSPLNNKINKSSVQADPCILDNLTYGRRSDTEGIVKDINNSIPCEFCNELFPVNCLLQHETVCQHVVGALDCIPYSKPVKKSRNVPIEEGSSVSPPLRRRGQPDPDVMIASGLENTSPHLRGSTQKKELMRSSSLSMEERLNIRSSSPASQKEGTTVPSMQRNRSSPAIDTAADFPNSMVKAQRSQPARLKTTVNNTNQSRQMMLGVQNLQKGDQCRQMDSQSQQEQENASTSPKQSAAAAQLPSRTNTTNSLIGSSEKRKQKSQSKKVASVHVKPNNMQVKESFSGAEELNRTSLNRTNMDRIRSPPTGARPKHPKPPEAAGVVHPSSVHTYPGGNTLGSEASAMPSGAATGAVPKQKVQQLRNQHR
ncbi:PREDICTED: TRAF-type zinc finger domain-containing protein 1-like isoform X2 [Priapulus caudatus]|uniref:TRAF-type zinc finger domain-containing protein 1-like isoform X2 n=1 Tax=Priapulus caudatus TaxID=37621 RepID=A0ABM1ENC9_PRICU|nr:PREDICTED: TRAF-type zinc finger domain-containing protein 1-like isoform X2 [Priapulus caudatus]